MADINSTSTPKASAIPQPQPLLSVVQRQRPHIPQQMNPVPSHPQSGHAMTHWPSTSASADTLQSNLRSRSYTNTIANTEILERLVMSQRREVLNLQTDASLASMRLKSAENMLEDLERQLQQARQRGP